MKLMEQIKNQYPAASSFDSNCGQCLKRLSAGERRRPSEGLMRGIDGVKARWLDERGNQRKVRASPILSDAMIK